MDADIPHGEIAVEPLEETDERVQDLADKEGCALLAFVAPYSGVRVTPVAEAYASIGVHEEFGIESFIDRCDSADVRKLRLLVNSPGGGVVSSYKVAKAIGAHFTEVRAFVPHLAASGGTLIALTGSEIVMGSMSHLTPLDLQVSYKGTFISSNTFLRCFERFMKAYQKLQPEEAPYPLRWMTEKLDPLIMEEMNGAIKTCLDYVETVLIRAGYGQDEASDKAIYLVTGFGDHSAVLDRELLAKEKFRVVPHTKYPEEWAIMRSWLKKYIGCSESVHHMRYCLPKKRKGGGRTAEQPKRRRSSLKTRP
jgi:hypothetical protein